MQYKAVKSFCQLLFYATLFFFLTSGILRCILRIVKHGFITIRQAAEARGVTAMTIHNWIAAGYLESEKILTPLLPAGFYRIVRAKDVLSLVIPEKRGRPRKQTETPADVATRAA